MIISNLKNLFSVKNKIIVVTGASRGIGLEIAKAFSLSGAKTIGLSRSESTLNSAKNLFFLKCDITNDDELKKIFHKIEVRFGRIDVLVNSAGITLDNSAEKDKFDLFNKTLETNLIGLYRCCYYASEIMKKNKKGSIVNITSIASKIGFPNNPAYVASKGAVCSMTKALAIDFADFGIRVNSVVPGYIKTTMTEKSFKDKKKFSERLNRMIIKRWGNADDIVGAVIYLASSASDYVTGADIVVDGGWTAKGL